MDFLKRIIRVGLLALLGGGLAVTSARAEFFLFKSFWGDVIVKTDTTPAGQELRTPTPETPVYYTGMSLGAKLGTIRGDTMPETEKMNLFVAKVLAKQGYLGARPGINEPSLFIVLQWGYIVPGSEDLLWFLGYNRYDDIGAPVMGGMLGPEVFRTGFRSRVILNILDDAKGPIYGIILTAFDAKTARSANPVALWQTRIGLPTSGKTMAEALPAMALAAGPSIGKPNDKPVLSSADDARHGSVRLGELQILDVLSGPKASDKK